MYNKTQHWRGVDYTQSEKQTQDIFGNQVGFLQAYHVISFWIKQHQNSTITGSSKLKYQYPTKNIKFFRVIYI